MGFSSLISRNVTFIIAQVSSMAMVKVYYETCYPRKNCITYRLSVVFAKQATDKQQQIFSTTQAFRS